MENNIILHLKLIILLFMLQLALLNSFISVMTLLFYCLILNLNVY